MRSVRSSLAHSRRSSAGHAYCSSQTCGILVCASPKQAEGRALTCWQCGTWGAGSRRTRVKLLPSVFWPALVGAHRSLYASFSALQTTHLLKKSSSQIGGGVLGDLWAPHERGQAIAVYSLAPLLGPVLGPVAGAWIAEKSTWRWVVRKSSTHPYDLPSYPSHQFWSTTIVDAAIQCVGFFALQESLYFSFWFSYTIAHMVYSV